MGVTEPLENPSFPKSYYTQLSKSHYPKIPLPQNSTTPKSHHPHPLILQSHLKVESFPNKTGKPFWYQTITLEPPVCNLGGGGLIEPLVALW